VKTATPELVALLRQRLKAARFEHSQGVVKTAVRLAKRHGGDPEQARLAGWLHDCGKALEREDMKPLLAKAGADAGERATPALWHAAVGAYLARHEYGVRDAEVLAAIRHHSTGTPKPSLLQKIIFVADYTEPGRPDWPELEKIRPLSAKNLDAAYLEVLKYKLMDLVERGRPVHPRSLAAYHSALSA
jgi:predicted HD superfamily hydrolase involved in NAD metabolism